MTILERLGRRRMRHMLRDESGVAAVEFGLIATLLFIMLAAAVDLTQAFVVQRDIKRFTAEAAMVLASLPDETLVATTGRQFNAKIANILPGKSGIEIGSAAVTRSNNAILVTIGTMTYMPPDANAKALAALANGDHGVVVRASYTHEPIILGFAERFGLSTRTFTAAAAALRLRNGQY